MATRTRPRAESTADRLRRVLAGVERHQHAHENPKVLRASGVKIERMSEQKLRAIVGNKQPWQNQAWGYRDAIGELRFALQYRARAISRARFFIAEILDDDDEPIPVELRTEVDDDGQPTERARKVTSPSDICAAAEQELNRLPLDSGYGFAGIWSENFDVAGECFLHGRRLPDGTEEWVIRSILDIDAQGSDITLKDELGQPRRLDLFDPAHPERDATEELYRLWVPHPARQHLADSALNALADVLEDILLAGREIRAASRSRSAANGVWMIPIGMTQVKNTRKEDDNPEDQSQRFMIDLTASLLAPIMNEGEPGAAAPIIITGTRDDIEAAAKSFIRFDRETNPEILARLDHALRRMGTSIDLPPEIITGLAEVNHWTAWQIDASTFRHYLEPGLRLMVDSLTTCFIRAALLAQKFPPDQVRKLRVWYDASQITENPNRRQDALDARAEGAIGDDAFRQALGFNDGDAPTPEERLLMIAAKGGIDQATAAAILAAWTQREGEAELLPTPASRTLPSQSPPPRQLPPGRAAPDQRTTGTPGAPDTAPDGVAASVAPMVAHRDEHTGRWVLYLDEVVNGELRLPERDSDTCRFHGGISSSPLGMFRSRAEDTPQRTGTNPYHLDTTTGHKLMETERALRLQLLTATDTAIHRAQDRAGSRLRSKTTAHPAIHANLRDQPVRTWAATLGRDATLALGADFRYLLNQAWDDLRQRFHDAVLKAVNAIAELVTTNLLRQEGSRAAATRDRIVAAMAARIPAAWIGYAANLDLLAEARLFGETVEDEIGEQADFAVPPYLVRAALAEIGGLPETSAGTEAGRSLSSEPLPGLGTGATVRAELEAAGVETVGYLWVYGVTPQSRKFEPHWELEGHRFTSWADPSLHPEPRYAWIGDFYRPGDHRGCMCDYVPGYAIPEYAGQVREKLAVIPQATQDILDLAASDDRAGRTGTTAQEIRDEHARIQALQRRFLEAG